MRNMSYTTVEKNGNPPKHCNTSRQLVLPFSVWANYMYNKCMNY